MNPSIPLSQFSSQGNKRILWELMTENNVFNNIPDKYVTNVKADFENCLTQMSHNIKPQDSILELNKQVIIKMINGVVKYAMTTLATPTLATPTLATAAEVSTKKQQQLQRGFETKREEFNNLIQPPKPATIDFTDKLDDEPIGSEMDIKLAQTIAWREKQLSQVLEKQDTSAANAWINNHIKIGDPTKIDERSIVNIKKVNFADTIVEPTTINFMDKLKRKDVNEDNSIKTDLIKIDIALIKDDIALIKDDIALIKDDMNTLSEQNKLLLENIDKIMDMLIK